MKTLIDTNVLIEVWGSPGKDAAWAASALTRCSGEGTLVVNPIVWSEIAPLLPSEERLDEMSAELAIEKQPLPWSAAFLAGITHTAYRRAGGTRERTLPDFLIGAHAMVAGYRMLTRDPVRYRTCFPSIEIIAPDTHP